MPSYFFELFTITYHLALKNGRIPAMHEVAKALGASRSAVIKRVQKMVALGYLAPYRSYSKTGWFYPTLDGGAAYLECLSNERDIIVEPSMGSISTNQLARHPVARYKALGRRDYVAQLEKIRQYGPLGAAV